MPLLCRQHLKLPVEAAQEQQVEQDLEELAGLLEPEVQAAPVEQGALMVVLVGAVITLKARSSLSPMLELAVQLSHHTASTVRSWLVQVVSPSLTKTNVSDRPQIVPNTVSTGTVSDANSATT